MRAREFIIESITDTPQFKRWFRNSVVVDSNGKPMVVYHGTIADFSTFSKKGVRPNFNSPQKQLGFFFTDDPRYADRYTKRWEEFKDGANTIPVYLALQNPKFEPIEKINEVEDRMKQGEAKAYRTELEGQGYDGIVFEGETPTGFVREYVAFRPEQIKSATGNNGNFDPKNPDITKEDRELIDEIRFEKSQQGFMDMTRDMDAEYKYAGSGYYSRVYQHPTQDKTLIKVFKNDRGYAEWLRFMASHQNNRYVPQIIPHEDGSIVKAYKFFKPLPGNQATTQRIGIVNLRKLEIATPDQREDFITYVLNYLNEDTQTRILSGRPPERRNINWFDKFTFGTEWDEIAQNSAKKDPDLSSVATELSRMMKRHGYLDVHNQNLMWDPERNNIVFIDVLSVG